ncbi:hypothetical protein INT45_003941, partial [Circinella minor]
GLLPLQAVGYSFVYEDIIAKPKYRVVLTEDKIPESSVYVDVDQEEMGFNNNDNSKDDALSTHFIRYNNQPDKTKQVIMMSAYGQPFQCIIPTIEEQNDESANNNNNNNKSGNENEKVNEQDTQKIIERGLKLLEPLTSKGCLYYQKPGYWTYEYCHKKHVRQFHVDRNAIQTDSPQQTPHGQSFYLGFFSPTNNNNDKDGSTTTTSTTNNEDMDITEPITSLRHVGDQRYLTQRWTGGSECDRTGKPRSIEVQFHCDMNSNDRISIFQEVTTCQYQMIITTPRLCQEMMLASQTQSDANKIQCNPIVPDHMLKSTSANQLEEEQPVIEEPAEPETQPEVHQTEKEEEEPIDKKDEQKNENILHQQTVNNKQQPMQDSNDNLLQIISGLTAQINDLQRQVGESGITSFENLLKGQQQQSDDSNKKEEIEIAYFHVDENGALVPEEGMDMKKLMETYVKMVNSVKGKQDENQQPVKKAKKTEEDQEQQRNKKAYEMTYFP